MLLFLLYFREEPALKKDKKRKAVSGRPVQSPTSREAPTNQAQADHYTGLWWEDQLRLQLCS